MREPFLLDRDRLLAAAAERREAYGSAFPFPHTVIDDFLPPNVTESVLDEFPTPEQIEWFSFNDSRERKLGTIDDVTMGPVTRQVLGQLNSAAAIDFLEELTGISGLVPDPHFHGGGLHQIEPGGFLKVHADFNLHPTTRLERRLNLLIYLNKEWKPEYHGALELWDATMTRCAQAIAPLFNRCVIFTTSEQSFHGHPDPLSCPPGSTRKSMALYYYTAPRVVDGYIVEHNTVFRGRPGEGLPDSAGAPTGGHLVGVRRVAARWLPPVLADGLRSFRANQASRP